MLPVIFVTSFLVGLSGAVSPGPLLALNIRESAARGFWAGPYISTGHSILELGVVVALAAGVSQAISSDVASGLIGLLGGSFLLWMGANMALGSRSATMPGRGFSPQGLGGVGGPVLAGALVSLANPYWVLWWLTVGASYLVIAVDRGVVGVVAFYVGHILADFAWYSFVSAAIASGRRIMTDAFYRGLLAACGLFLLVGGGYFIYSGVGFLR